MKKIKYMYLWELTNWNKKFVGVEKEKQLKRNNIKSISSNILKSLYSKTGDIKLLSTGNFDGFTTQYSLKDLTIYDDEIITIPEGGRANIKYWKGKFINSLNLVATNANPNLYNLKYVWYYLLKINEKIESFFRGSGVKHPDMKEILDIQIPIPPLETQNKIVNILDKFSKYEAELVLRNKQYEYYRNKLFINKSIFTKIKLSLLINIDKGKQLNKELLLQKGEFPVINGGQLPSGYWNEYNTLENSITISQGGNSAGFVNWQNNKFWAGAHCYIINLKDNNLNYKYLYYFLKTKEPYLMKSKYGAGIPSLSKKDILNLEIPIPPLETQNKIVNILDKFNTLLNDINEGLPKEKELRKKQYEYYRDKLLNFNN